ncbi:TPA: aminotransferase class I/II-fold pyridoxal phosphate-dependent enzyme [Candidatus Micrarchaeota archaeon]|nr:aminotransferase class I/II-fold pyridoxal phosphate-dependent enzyme [Candidatus Micrarchaeota archaeon]
MAERIKTNSPKNWQTYVFIYKIQHKEFMAVMKKRLPIIHADRDENNFPLPKKVVGVIGRMDQNTIGFYRKNDPLVGRIAAEHKITEDRVFLGQGAEGVINQVFDSIMKTNPNVLLPSLGYSLYFDIARARGANIDTFRFVEGANSYYYDVRDVVSRLSQKPGLLVLIDPESPLGFSIKKKDLDAILEKTEGNTVVILDQAHEGVRTGEVKSIKELVGNYPNLIVVRSFSKLYGLASLRIGYAVCGEKAGRNLTLPSNRLGFPGITQDMAIAALDSKDEYGKIARQARKQKRKFNEAVGKMRNYGVHETDHLSCMVKVPENYNKTLIKLAEARNIRIRNLVDYHPELNWLYRVTIGPEEQTVRLIELFQAVDSSMAKRLK